MSSTNGSNGNSYRHHTTIDPIAFKNVTFDAINEAADFIKEKIEIRPLIGIICGTGLGSVADRIQNKVVINYNLIPNFPRSTVEGHAGELHIGMLNGVATIAMKGRFHYYEGYTANNCCIPVRVMKLLGVEIMIVTNAAGGVNQRYRVGDIMLIRDHINFIGLGGGSALRGPNDNEFGPRFVPLDNCYDKAILKDAQIVIKQLDMDDKTHKGVYACVGGPNFETIAEVIMLERLGVDAVGMSTAHEVIAARHCGIKCFAFSLITNVCNVDYDNYVEPNHEDVMNVGEQMKDQLSEMVHQLVKIIATKHTTSV